MRFLEKLLHPLCFSLLLGQLDLKMVQKLLRYPKIICKLLFGVGQLLLLLLEIEEGLLLVGKAGGLHTAETEGT